MTKRKMYEVSSDTGHTGQYEVRSRSEAASEFYSEYKDTVLDGTDSVVVNVYVVGDAGSERVPFVLDESGVQKV